MGAETWGEAGGRLERPRAALRIVCPLRSSSRVPGGAPVAPGPWKSALPEKCPSLQLTPLLLPGLLLNRPQRHLWMRNASTSYSGPSQG